MFLLSTIEFLSYAKLEYTVTLLLMKGFMEKKPCCILFIIDFGLWFYTYICEFKNIAMNHGDKNVYI